MSGYELTRDQHIWCGRNDYMEGHEVSEIKNLKASILYIISAMLVGTLWEIYQRGKACAKIREYLFAFFSILLFVIYLINVYYRSLMCFN